MPGQKRPQDAALSIISRSPDDTRRVGAAVGRLAAAGLAVALYGDLGVGKTVFAQGVAHGLDVPDTYYVTSPTYTIVNEYPGRLPLVHMDFYRLEAIEDLESIGIEDVTAGEGVVVIEWAERLPASYLGDHLSVSLTVRSDDTREIKLIPYGQRSVDLIEEVNIQLKE